MTWIPALKTFSACLALSITLALLKGCAEPPPKAARKEDRGITVIQKMRTEAVSRNVGRWAVVIGISDYKYDSRWDARKGIPDLRYADRDARMFSEFLMSPAGGAFPADRVILLTNHQATVKEVRKAIGDFLSRSLEDDLVIIFYAGHGVADPQRPDNLYLLCHDSEPGNYYGTALPMWEIDVALNRTIKSRKVLVLADACHSAGVGGVRGEKAAEKFNEYIKKLAGSKEGVTKITASRADELSQERDDLGGGHGIFTYYLLDGLRGRGDANADGFVTMKEAYDYLYDRVRSETGHSQHPWASPYVSDDVPLGITDAQVLAAVKTLAEAKPKTERPAPSAYRPQPVSDDIPRDSAVALKLARAKLSKDDRYTARDMVEAVIARSDNSKPEALALKIELCLLEGDIKAAEDTEDLLVIPYAAHPAAAEGARKVYDYYLKRSSDKQALIQDLETYIKRHRGGLLEKEAGQKLAGVKSGIKTRYEKDLDESLVLARGFIGQERFERAREELSKAREKCREALSSYGITLNTSAISDLEAQADKAEVAHRSRMFESALSKAVERFKAGDYSGGYSLLEEARKYAGESSLARVDEIAARYNAPPEVKITAPADEIDWDSPVRFTFEAKDREGDPVRIVAWDFGDGTSATEGSPEHSYGKWSGPEKERRFTVTARVTDGHSTVSAKKTIMVKKQDWVKTFTVNGVSFKMIRVPAGEFMMGSPSNESGRYDNETQHRVRITKDYWLGETEVTQGLWKVVMGSNPSSFSSCGDDCPVEQVSWNDCQEFIMRLNSMVSGGGFRLPTEAEWEYAARAGTTTAIYTGSMRILGDNNSPELDPIAWYGGNSCVSYSGGYDCSGWSGKQYSCSSCGTNPVAKKKPNSWGLYDMIGNVWEWCEDWYGDYPSGSVTDPAGASSGSGRVLRGGGWGGNAGGCRSADRGRDDPGNRYSIFGFRLARP